MGRRKISIAPIADDRNRSVTFLKRKNGLFKKAYELGVLCSADVAVIVFSNTGKLFEFHSGDMDQILLRYSHYSGPAYEKKGPEDYASKDVDEIAKLGLGGKMTVLDQAARAAAAAEDEDDASDESGGEESKSTPAPAAKGKGKAVPRGKSASASASVAKSEVTERQDQQGGQDENYGFDPARMGSMAAGQAPPGFGQLPFNPQGFPGFPGGFPSLPGIPGQQHGQFGQQPQPQPGWPYGAGQANGARPGQPPMGMSVGGQQPWMNPAAAAQHQLPPWAMQAAAFGGLGGPPGSGAPAMASMPGFAMPDFGLLQQAYQQSQQGAGGPFFGAGGQGGVPGYSPQHPLANLGLAQQQQQQQLAQLQQQQLQQHQQAAHLAQQQQQQQLQSNSSSPAAIVATPETAAGSPMLHDSRPGSVASQSRTEGGVSRSNSATNKPRLSVNIPGEQGASNGGAVTQEGGNGVYTAEPEGMENEDGSRTAHPDHPARYASDILPSPSNFLADIPYSAGGGYSLSGLNTAIAMASDDPSGSGSVFSWPTTTTKNSNDSEERKNGFGPAPMLGEDEGRDLFGLGGEPLEEETERRLKNLKRASQDEGEEREETEGQESPNEETGRRTRTRR